MCVYKLLLLEVIQTYEFLIIHISNYFIKLISFYFKNFSVTQPLPRGGSSFKGLGVEGFEPPTFCSQSRRTTKLSYTPKWWVFKDLKLGLLIYETSALTN